MDFREHKGLIKRLIAQESDKDVNWKWSVSKINKRELLIRWGYLDYLEEKKNCFIIKAEKMIYKDSIFYCKPDGEVIDITSTDDEVKAITEAINEITYYAHSRY